MPTPKWFDEDGFDSFHKKLNELIAYEECKLALFKEAEAGAFYGYEERPFNIFTTYEKVVKDIIDNYDEKKDIIISKMFPDYGGNIRAYCDRKGVPKAVGVYGNYHNQKIPELDFNSNLFSNHYYVEIPSPFERGDILVINDGYSKEIIVLKDDDEEFLAKEHAKEERNDGCTTRWGISVDRDGFLHSKGYNYDEAEYYKGDFQGDNRMLQYLSWHLKGKLSLVGLMEMQNVIAMQHKLNDSALNCPFGWYLYPDGVRRLDEQFYHDYLNNDWIGSSIGD
jgi:hypothetical protein